MFMGFLGKVRKKGEERKRGRGNERGKEKRGEMKQNETKKNLNTYSLKICLKYYEKKNKHIKCTF